MKIECFESGPHRFMSNFWPATVNLDGIDYVTVEHAYQAAKSLDPDKREIVRDMPSPAAAKRAGRRLKSRTDWDAVKVDVMRALLQQKFAYGTALRRQLDATAPATLEEGNTWGDTFWGVCGGRGRNMLGKLLMEIRDGVPVDDFDTLL